MDNQEDTGRTNTGKTNIADKNGNIAGKATSTVTTTTTKMTTATPQKLFTELTELRSHDDVSYWKETAR